MSDIDEAIGQRIRERRIAMGKTQHELAGAIGVTFQQVQKYESGFNRVSSSRLWDIAQALNTNISTFFDTLGDDAQRISAAAEGDMPDPAVQNSQEARTLIRTFRQLPEEQRRALLALARSLDPTKR